MLAREQSPTGSPNSNYLQFNNSELITVVYSGGAFDVDGFLFNGPGNGGDIEVSDGGTPLVLSESFNGNDMTPVTFTTECDGATSFTFQNVGKGTGRVDNISSTWQRITLPGTGAGPNLSGRRISQSASASPKFDVSRRSGDAFSFIR